METTTYLNDSIKRKCTRIHLFFISRFWEDTQVWTTTRVAYVEIRGLSYHDGQASAIFEYNNRHKGQIKHGVNGYNFFLTLVYKCCNLQNALVLQGEATRQTWVTDPPTHTHILHESSFKAKLDLKENPQGVITQVPKSLRPRNPLTMNLQKYKVCCFCITTTPVVQTSAWNFLARH